jgi:hypothetical protein
MNAQERMKRAKTAILCRKNTDLFTDIVAKEKGAFSGLRTLFASDVAGVNLQFEDIPNIANIFTGKGLLAFSQEIDSQMAQGKANLEFDQCVLLDTNFLSDLPRYFSGEAFSNPNQREKIEEVLNFVDRKLGRSFNFSFVALENLLEARKPNNPHPHRKVAAAKAYGKFGCSATSADIESCQTQAERFWLDFLTNEENWKALHRRDMVYCILLKAQLLRWSKHSLNDAVLELVRLSLSYFEKLALKEIYFGWKLLRGNVAGAIQLDIFHETDLNKPTKKSLDRISALAWDLFLFRHIESSMTLHKGNKFFVPLVSTFDKGLLQAIQLCPLRALIMDDVSCQVQAVFDDELEFEICLREAIKGDADITIRMQNPQAQGALASNFSRVSKEICKLEEMVNKCIQAT